MELRPATAADVPAIKALVDRAYEHYVERLGMRPGPMDFDHGAAVAEGRMWLAGDAGILEVGEHDGAFWVEDVAVDPGRQGQGVGKALLDHAERLAREGGHTELRLVTHELMWENRERYARWGWEDLGLEVEGRFRRHLFRKAL